jgi:DDE family transposase
VVTLVGQRVFGIALGYEDLNDHDELRHDPLMAVLAGKLEARRQDCAPVAGKSTLNRLELSCLEPTRYHKISHNPVAIRGLFVDLFLEAHDRAPHEIILDLDATDDPVHGEQEGRFFHGYYDCYCYLPLYVFCGRHLLAAKLRRANIDAAAGSVEEVARMVAQIRRRWPCVRILLRADSGFAREELMAWCEANGVHFLFGLAKTDRLIAEIKAELEQAAAQSRRTGKPARRFKDFRWTTRTSWSRQRRVVAKAEWTKDEANPRFVVTSLTRAECKASTFMRRFTAPAATWRTGSRSVSSISMPIAPRPPPCGQTSCACGLPQWPMCCCVPCAASPCITRRSPKRPAAPSVSSCSRSAPSCA